jgi:hypothetical protein
MGAFSKTIERIWQNALQSFMSERVNFAKYKK